MADADDLGLEAEEPVEEAPPADLEGRLKYLESKLAKSVEAERSLRSRLGRTELEAKYGKDVVELIPESMPLSERAEFAEKLAAKIRVEPPVEGPGTTETVEAPAEAPTSDERKLVAAQGAPPPGASAVPTDMSPRELLELGKTDKKLADQLIAAKYGAR